MPACCAAVKDDADSNEFRVSVRSATVHEVANLKLFESPDAGYAVAFKGADASKLLENAFLETPNADLGSQDKLKVKDFDAWLSSGEVGDGFSTLYDSNSDMSEEISVASTEGPLGPSDLMVVGHSLHPLASGSAEVSEDGEQSVPLYTAERDEYEADAEEEAQCETIKRIRTADWWDASDSQAIKGLEHSQQVSTLLDARVIKSKADSKRPQPWEAGQSSDLYTSMGMVDPQKGYLAVWLNLGSSSLLFVLELTDLELMSLGTDDKFLSQRLKFVFNPVKMRGAMPSKALKDSEAVGSCFGKKNTSSTCGVTDRGVRYMSVQVDVFSKWMYKLGFQNVGLRLGNILELLLVDGPSVSVLAGCRLTMTPELLELMAA